MTDKYIENIGLRGDIKHYREQISQLQVENDLLRNENAAQTTIDLIELKTAELVGEQLAWAAGKAEGLDLLLAPPIYGNPWRVFVRYTGEVTIRDVRYNPWEDWAVGGQLIQKYRVGFGLYSDSFFAVTGLDDIPGDADGPTHLIAACRAVVAAKLGDTVQVPKELMP